MASGASGEVVHCPNCKEDVPKTLYCLNCGFPLYKEEQPNEEKVEPTKQPEPSKQVVPPEDDAIIVVDDEEEEAKPMEPKMEVPATPEVKVDAPTPPVVEVKESEPAPEPEPVQATPMNVEAPSPVVEKAKPVEAPAEVKPAETEEIKPAEIPSEPLSTGSEPTEIKAVEMVEEYQAPKVFTPDPLTKDLMENLTKNISLKIKLVKLYRDGVIKEETFTKLFESYDSEGKLWYSRREELLRKLAAEMEEMEDAYNAASEALELLEVRKSIGDASSGEYSAKAPAYRWDIDNFDNMIGDKRNRTAYLENVANALTEAELKELRELASVQYNTLESLQVSKDEVLARIKDSLYEAIKTLG